MPANNSLLKVQKLLGVRLGLSLVPQTQLGLKYNPENFLYLHRCGPHTFDKLWKVPHTDKVALNSHMLFKHTVQTVTP